MDYNFNSGAGMGQFVGDPDLIFLRNDAADELGAVVGYLECADLIRQKKLSELFRHTASDEAGHFSSLLRLISGLDPVQAEAFQREGLLGMTMIGAAANPAGIVCQMGYDNQNNGGLCLKKHHSGDRKSDYNDEAAVECLKNAIRDELHAINAYQQQIANSNNPAVQALLISIMNEEKEHVAEFTKALCDLWQE